MKPVNMFSKCEGWNRLMDLLCRSLPYEQTSEWLAAHGYYIPRDQFDALSRALDIQLELDIGERQAEVHASRLERTKA